MWLQASASGSFRLRHTDVQFAATAMPIRMYGVTVPLGCVQRRDAGGL